MFADLSLKGKRSFHSWVKCLHLVYPLWGESVPNGEAVKIQPGEGVKPNKNKTKQSKTKPSKTNHKSLRLEGVAQWWTAFLNRTASVLSAWLGDQTQGCLWSKRNCSLQVCTLAQVRSSARGGSGSETEDVVSTLRFLAIALGFPLAGVGWKWLHHTLLGRWFEFVCDYKIHLQEMTCFSRPKCWLYDKSWVKLTQSGGF